MYTASSHQKQQLAVIGQIERAVDSNRINFSTVTPTTNYALDPRLCLTSVHFPDRSFIETVRKLIEPLKKIDKSIYFYPDTSFHLTIKNLRTINDPANFDEPLIAKAQTVFHQVIPLHHAFQAYYYRLLLFPGNLVLIGTTDEELDRIIFDLNRGLIQAGIPDDKVYLNDKYFFSNVTLARFTKPISQAFRAKVSQISEAMEEFTYRVDSVSLVTANASLNRLRKINTWRLK
ncbi:MAG TPA: hypothetical protein VGA89_02775 [Patescibacteria group bacterium]|jgi:2'-5' RNA ligase